MQDVSCGAYGVLQNYTLVNSADGAKMRYVYSCCTGSWVFKGRPENIYYTDWNSGGESNRIARQPFQCPNGEALSGFVLRRGDGLATSTDNVRYEYRCKRASLLAPATYQNSGTDPYFTYGGPIGGTTCCRFAAYVGCTHHCGVVCIDIWGQVYTLDQQPVQCKQPVQVLTGAQLYVQQSNPGVPNCDAGVGGCCNDANDCYGGYCYGPVSKQIYNWYYSYQCSSADIGM